ncbi:MAG: hypothetical protein LBG43_08590 [Treponema sp.]|nr:hypothetical protein [Treponema sp.]
MKATISFSGGNIDTVWLSMIKPMFAGAGVATDDAKHSVTTTQNQPAEPMSEDDIAELLAQGLQVNQNGTIKLPASSIAENSPEIIMTKR